MQANGTPRILVCAEQLAACEELRRLLEAGGNRIDCHAFNDSQPPEIGGHQLVVVDGTRQNEAALHLCRQLRGRLHEEVVPILYVTEDHAPATRLASFEAGADTYLLRPFAPGELLAQVGAFLRIKDVHDRLADKTAEVHRINKRLQQAYQQIDQELELAHRIQTSFLPQTLPSVPRVRFAVHYSLRGRVGGDFYDAFRLDENHVGFYVADAMGHGVPASLLTIFVKMGVKAKEVSGQHYRLVPPGEVLDRLNKDLIAQEMSETPFITMVYALFNHGTGTLRFARAGHPYPLHVSREGEVSLWRSEGLLLGVTEARFPEQTRQLTVGDKVLLYSDGIDSATFEANQPGTDSLLACAERHRALPVQAFLDRLARELFRDAEPPDDLTLLGLEVCG
jgi:sigma-B regulation protein RsbU (phosphoserine phosphatase)